MPAKILIIDDEAEMLRMLEISLRKNYDIITALSAEEAFNKLQHVTPDLAIVDIMLPGVSGLDIVRQLRVTPATINLPIIILSAKVQVEDKIAGLEAGADEYVTKPVIPAELNARVANLLERTQRLLAGSASATGRVLGFIGAKGGVGTSTVALNVFTQLSSEKTSAVGVELMPYAGSFAAMLRTEPVDNLGGLLATPAENLNARLVQDHLVALQAGQNVLFSPQKVEEYKALPPNFVTALINQLAEMFDYVILDLPHHPSAALWTAVQRCDHLSLILEPNGVAVDAARMVLNMLDSWKIKRGRLGVVCVNQSQGGLPLTHAEIREYLSCDFVGIVPPMRELIRAAQDTGATVARFNPNHMGSKSLIELAERLSTESVIPLRV